MNCHKNKANMVTGNQGPLKDPFNTMTRQFQGQPGASSTPKNTASKIFIPVTCTYTALKRKYPQILQYIDPSDDSTPRASTVFWSTICFVAFVISGGFAI